MVVMMGRGRGGGGGGGGGMAAEDEGEWSGLDGPKKSGRGSLYIRVMERLLLRVSNHRPTSPHPGPSIGSRWKLLGIH